MGLFYIFISLSFCYTVGSAVDIIVLSFIRLSVRLPVTLCMHCSAHGWCSGSNLYQRVPKSAIPIHSFRHFCCSIVCRPTV